MYTIFPPCKNNLWQFDVEIRHGLNFYVTGVFCQNCQGQKKKFNEYKERIIKLKICIAIDSIPIINKNRYRLMSVEAK